jgi:propanediol dehydratase large subunit
MNILLSRGNVGLIAKVIHKDFKKLDHYIAKHNAYSTGSEKVFATKAVKTVSC